MFIGHYAAALAAKRLAPKTSLGTLVFGAQFLDLLWPLLLLLNVEHFRIAPGDTRFTPLDFYDYPISHSLLAVIGWAAVVGVLYFGLNRGFRRDHEGNARAAWVMAALVMSHWVLDAVVHRPDLPLRPGGTTLVGLGLWNSVAGTLVLETLLYGAAVVAYLRGTAADCKGRGTFWVFIFVIYAFYVASAFGPPPPTVGAVAWVGMGQWLFVLWAWWVDRPSRGATGVEASA
ncbi:MAG TPA: hypothetical protein VG892_05105 [Terriglobales bacterium]|nr:hypothetical protein [Terriglobales bacterium]